MKKIVVAALLLGACRGEKPERWSRIGPTGLEISSHVVRPSDGRAIVWLRRRGTAERWRMEVDCRREEARVLEHWAGGTATGAGATFGVPPGSSASHLLAAVC